jgi:hypothetical protein
VVKTVVLMLVLMSLLLSIFTMGLSQALILLCILFKLVNPFVVCVCDLLNLCWKDMSSILSLIFSRLCWCLNNHPYTSHIKCFAMTHTHLVGWAHSYDYLFCYLLNHWFVASARLCLISLHTCTCVVFLSMLGEWWSNFCELCIILQRF